jgi:formate dehydrogenase major subunit
VNDKEVFLPYHWGGVYKGQDLSDRYPDGLTPLAIGDSVNIITSPGYDSETQMQETKPALVRVRQATEDLLNELNMDTHLLNEGFPQDEAGLGRQKTYDVRDRPYDSH